MIAFLLDFYGMDGFCADGVCSCDDCFIILVIACYYLPTQGAYLCKLCLYLLGYFLGFLPGNAYMLEELDGVKFPVAVNGQHLKKYISSMWDSE